MAQLPDVALAGQEHQDVPRTLVTQFVDHRDDAVVQVRLSAGDLLRRLVAQLHRIAAPGDLDNGCVVEELREALRVDGGRADDQFQIPAAREQRLDVPEQEIDVEAAFVGLVDDDRVVGAQVPIRLDLRQQHAVGQHLQVAIVTNPLVEAKLVADTLAEVRIELVGDARGGAAGRDPPRLRMTDEPVGAAAYGEADLRQLRGLPRTGLAAHDDHRVGADGLADLGDVRADRECLGEARARQAPVAGFRAGFNAGHCAGRHTGRCARARLQKTKKPGASGTWPLGRGGPGRLAYSRRTYTMLALSLGEAGRSVECAVDTC